MSTAFFTNPSQLEQTLCANGWLSAFESDRKRQFWELCWNQQAPASLDPSIMATFPNFDPVLSKCKRRALCREEYVRLYNWLCEKERSNEHAEEGDDDDSARRIATTITGHPGIGKTIFQQYILYRRCLDNKPTLYYDGLEDTLVLFYHRGVLTLPKKEFDNLSLQPFTPHTWVLLDGPRKGEVVPKPLVLPARTTHPRIVFTASPSHRERWQQWEKDGVVNVVVYMQGWTEEELEYGALLHDIPWNTVTNRRTFVGPVPRYLFTNERKYKSHIADIQSSLSALSLPALLSLFSANPIIPTHNSDLLQYTTLPDSTNIHAPPTLVILSPFVQQGIRRRVLLLEHPQRVEVINLFSPGQGIGRGFSDDVYGMHIIDRLTNPSFVPFEVNLYRLVRLPSRAGALKRKLSGEEEEEETSRNRPQPRWHTAYGRPSNHQKLQALRDTSYHNPEVLKLDRMGSELYENLQVPPVGSIPKIHSNTLYIPLHRNEGIDAFYVKNQVLWLLRMTTAVSHEVDPKTLVQLGKRFNGLPDRANFVFVQSHPTCMVVPYQEMSDMDLFHVCILATEPLAEKLVPEEAPEQDEELVGR